MIATGNSNVLLQGILLAGRKHSIVFLSGWKARHNLHLRQFNFQIRFVDVSSEKVVITLLQIAAICIGPLPINYYFCVIILALKQEVNRPRIRSK